MLGKWTCLRTAEFVKSLEKNAFAQKMLSYCHFKLSNCVCAEIRGLEHKRDGETAKAEKGRRAEGNERARKRELEKVRSTPKTEHCGVPRDLLKKKNLPHDCSSKKLNLNLDRFTHTHTHTACFDHTHTHSHKHCLVLYKWPAG